jgi:hypothetical protein
MSPAPLGNADVIKPNAKVVKCPKCVEAGKTSRVFVGENWGQCVPTKDYYDENGKWTEHTHYFNTISLSCSDGHKWKITEFGKCPVCAYPD